MVSSRLSHLLEDPFLVGLYEQIRAAGKMRSISLDLTHRCNLRCEGCYFFFEGMDRATSPTDNARFEEFITREKARGTNFITVVGGEPSLELERLARLYESFSLNVATNGLIPIPYDGFENLPIGVSVWGSSEIDRDLRGGGRRDVFEEALKNYENDSRAFWYYTVTAGRAHEIESVVDRCVANGNRVLFNYYSDLSGLGGAADHRLGFTEVEAEIERMIDRFPERVFMSSYLNRVVARGRLYGQEWGHAVCTSVSVDHPANQVRLGNGKPYVRHFKAYNSDFETTRRCCTGNERDCSSCFDVWQHFSWIVLNLRLHLGSAQEFTDWLTTTYLFYLINRLVDFERGIELLPEIHHRSRIAHPPVASFEYSRQASN
jgi:MoaA/NifB/PqqE/SkfB family radical SAM enzyme